MIVFFCFPPYNLVIAFVLCTVVCLFGRVFVCFFFFAYFFRYITVIKSSFCAVAVVYSLLRNIFFFQFFFFFFVFVLHQTKLIRYLYICYFISLTVLYNITWWIVSPHNIDWNISLGFPFRNIIEALCWCVCVFLALNSYWRV